MRRQVYVGNTQCVAEKYVKKVFGKRKGKIQAALERLDRFTKEEERLAVAQTWRVVQEIKRLLSLPISLQRPTVFCR